MSAGGARLPAPIIRSQPRHGKSAEAIARDQGRPVEALDQAERATLAQPRDTLGWVLKGEALSRLARFGEAEQAYRAALALDPDEPRSRIGLGWMQLRAGREAQAAATWRPVLGMAADDSTLRAMQALYEKLGDREAAEAARARR